MYAFLQVLCSLGDKELSPVHGYDKDTLLIAITALISWLQKLNSYIYAWDMNFIIVKSSREYIEFMFFFPFIFRYKNKLCSTTMLKYLIPLICIYQLLSTTHSDIWTNLKYKIEGIQEDREIGFMLTSFSNFLCWVVPHRAALLGDEDIMWWSNVIIIFIRNPGEILHCCLPMKVTVRKQWGLHNHLKMVLVATWP